jgi:DDE superfamily endonuclease
MVGADPRADGLARVPRGVIPDAPQGGEAWPRQAVAAPGPQTVGRLLAAGQALEHQPRSAIRPKKKHRDRLMPLAAQHADWVLGFADETWWSRVTQPALHRWTAGKPLRLVEQAAPQGDPDPKALARDGLLRTDQDKVWLRFVDGRPVSHVTTAFLAWLCERLAAEQKRVLVLRWDHASWHISQEVRAWVRAHHQQVKRHGGIRLLTWCLSIKSPWLNPIEPHWVHGKRAIVEPARLLTAAEIISRVSDYFGCEHVEHLTQGVA